MGGPRACRLYASALESGREVPGFALPAVGFRETMWEKEEQPARQKELNSHTHTCTYDMCMTWICVICVCMMSVSMMYVDMHAFMYVSVGLHGQ